LYLAIRDRLKGTPKAPRIRLIDTRPPIRHDAARHAGRDLRGPGRVCRGRDVL
jgi:hypothetical protein